MENDGRICVPPEGKINNKKIIMNFRFIIYLFVFLLNSCLSQVGDQTVTVFEHDFTSGVDPARVTAKLGDAAVRAGSGLHLPTTNSALEIAFDWPSDATGATVGVWFRADDKTP